MKALTGADLIARHGIANALANHSRGVDRADFNLLSAAYHPDATVDYGFFAGPAETLATILAEAQKSSLPTLHRTSNIWIKRTGDSATSESYVTAYIEDEKLQRIVLGRYLDRHECRDGEWRLSHRTYIVDGNSNRTSTVQRADPPVSHDNYVPEGGKGAADAGRALLAHHIASTRHLQGATSMSADSAALDAALSRAAIHDLAMAYSRAVDRADPELMRSIFWDDSTVISGIINGNGSEFAEQICAFVTANLEYCFHSVANEWIEVKGDHAVGEHYVIAQMTIGGQDVMTGGRYLDSYERRKGVWKIKSRTFVTDCNSTHPTTLQRDDFYEALKNWGSFGKNDPVYAHWGA
ncbi:nuclear transport factor 2 family protein [Sphingomonas sp.]|uniref:nuclear transport factor 2 family protein n=1 Tax=Sphingomonas sp. TaxID=28214 RepID=UPI003752C0C6